MRGCLQVVAGFLAFVFVVTVVVAVAAVNLVQIGTNRDLMKSSLDLGPLITKVGPTLLVEEMRQQASARGVMVEDIDTALLQEAAAQIVPPDWMDAQVDAAVDALFNVLETGDPETAVAHLDLQPVLQRFQAAEGREAVDTLLHSLPACPDPQPQIDLASGDLEIPGCLPKGVSVSQAVDVVYSAALQTIDENPQLLEKAGQVEVNLFQPEQMTDDSRQQLERLSLLFRFGQKGAWLFWLIPFGLLILIALLAVRSLSEWGHWWGWSLLAAAGFTFILVFLIPTLMRLLFQALGPPAGGTEIETLMLNGIRDLIEPLMALFRRRVFIQTVIILAAGVGFIALGFLSGGKSEKLPEAGEWDRWE